jgi:hypothetical protein
VKGTMTPAQDAAAAKTKANQVAGFEGQRYIEE